jgi:hypothetical protein
LETLTALQRQAAAVGGAAAACARDVDAEAGELLRRIPLRDIEITSAEDPRPYPDVGAADLERLREIVSRGAVEIQRLL